MCVCVCVCVCVCLRACVCAVCLEISTGYIISSMIFYRKRKRSSFFCLLFCFSLSVEIAEVEADGFSISHNY